MDKKWTLMLIVVMASMLIIVGLAVAFWPNKQSGEDNNTALDPPGAPIGLQAMIVEGGVKLSWSVPTNEGSGIDGYNIYRSNSSILGSLPIGHESSLSYTDHSVIEGRYYYVVKAFNTHGESPSSIMATVLVESNVSANRALTNGNYLSYEGMQTGLFGFRTIGLRFDFFNVTSDGFDVTWSGSNSGTSHYSWNGTIGAVSDLGAFSGNSTLDTVYGTKNVSLYQNQLVDSASRTWTITYYVGITVPVIYKLIEHCDIQDTYNILNLESTNIAWVKL